MSKQNFIIIAALIVVLTAAVFLANKQKNRNIEPIKVGLIYPLSGPAANVGEVFRNAAMLAQEDLNQRDGILGRRIELVVEDGEADPNKSIAAFTKLTTIDQTPIILTTISRVALPLIPLANEKSVLLFADIAHPKATAQGNLTLRHSNTATQEAQLVTQQLPAILDNQKQISAIGIVAMNDEYGTSYRDELETQLKTKWPSTIITSELYDPKEKDFKTIIAKVKAQNPQAVILVGFGPVFGILIKQIRELGYKGELVTSIGLTLTPDAVKIAESVLHGTWYIAYAKTEKSNAFEERYQSRFGKKSGGFGLFPYGDLELLSHTMRQTRSVDPAVVAQTIRSMGKFEATYETMHISPQGDILPPLELVQWK